MSYQMQQLSYLIGLTIVLFFLWHTPALYPLKILVVFFHESSHAIATLLTGVRVIEMEVVKEAGGHVISSGGNRFITLTAGYLGSLVWGVSIFLLAVGTHWDRWLMGALGSILVAITLIFIENAFAYGFGLGMGALMILSAKYLSTQINDVLLRIIGLTSILYVPLDIYSDTIARSNLRSDARMLAEETGIATLIWGGIWLGLSLIMIYYCFRLSIKLNPNASKTQENHP
ncbi:MAG: M50 family metallopeptidase [Methylococcales bacterium]|nr:M50 family metallopeptidase [Methylococcales bacterium]MBT7445532.1 M50 family metallopeptidase [Methylococcales bacterium]